MNPLKVIGALILGGLGIAMIAANQILATRLFHAQISSKAYPESRKQTLRRNAGIVKAFYRFCVIGAGAFLVVGAYAMALG